MKKIPLFLLTIFIYLIGCTESGNYDTDKNNNELEELFFYSEQKTEHCISSKEIFNLDILEDLEIVFLNVESKTLFYRSAANKNQIYYSDCTIDSAFFVEITNSEHMDKIYIGSFYPTSLNKIKLTFISIFSFDIKKNEYLNSYNSYYFVEKSFIDIQIVFKLINNSNALFISNYEGSGNFLDINLIARRMNKLDDITPEIPLLSQGEYIIDTSRIMLMEGLAAWEIKESQEMGLLQVKKLDTIPIIDFQEGDKIIKFKKRGNKITTDSKIYVCDWTGIIHLQIDEPSNELLINFDPQYFKRKFNQLIPLKTGYTSLELIDSDFNYVISNIKIVIN